MPQVCEDSKSPDQLIREQEAKIPEWILKRFNSSKNLSAHRSQRPIMPSQERMVARVMVLVDNIYKGEARTGVYSLIRNLSAETLLSLENDMTGNTMEERLFVQAIRAKA
jgi:hypothetical protein